MEKRIFLAIVLSILVLASWQLLMPKPYHVDKNEVTANNAPEETSLALPDKPPAASNLSALSASEKQGEPLGGFETSKAKFNIINPGGRIKDAYFKDYNLNFEVNGVLYNKIFKDNNYTLQKSNGKLTLSCNQNGHLITKILVFNDANYYIDAEIIYQNVTSADWTFQDEIIIDILNSKADPVESRLFEVVFLGENGVFRKNPLQVKDRFVQSGDFNVLGFRNRYSCVIVKPIDTNNKGSYIEKHNGKFDIGLNLDSLTVPANSQITRKFTVYCGPQDVNILKNNGLRFEEIVHFGGFDIISNIILSSLRLFHRITHNWGVALIFLSIFVFLALYPLTLKQLNAMKQMQMLQPQIEALRKTYKDNPQRLNKEIMELYRRHKANPLGGCLPMILQIPIFFGLYQALSRSIDLKGSAFLWIKDLAEPDRLFKFPAILPFIGEYFNLLPVLMAIAMFFQQKLSMKTTSAASGTSADQQKMMLVLFPLLFGFIFYNFPSGLALYWFINTVLSAISQWKNTHKISQPKPVE